MDKIDFFRTLAREGVIDLLSTMYVREVTMRHKEVKDFLRGNTDRVLRKLREHTLLEKTIVKEGSDQYEAYRLTLKANYFLEGLGKMNVKFP